ncbi:MAG: hypothetical protein AB1458_04250 [Bacteroidota bacterium]
MKIRLLPLFLLILSGFFLGLSAQTNSPAVVFGSGTDEIKTSVSSGSVSFSIVSQGFDHEAFKQKAQQYAKMFTISVSQGDGVMLYTVKFNTGFENMKYLMRLFTLSDVKEIKQNDTVMDTEKFFSQFN